MGSPTDLNVTQRLKAWHEGDAAALAEVLPVVYEPLYRIARRHMADERAGHTLQPTALLNELVIRIVGEHPPAWLNRQQFFGAMAERMRHILVDHARKKKAEKRGAGKNWLTLEDRDNPAGGPPDKHDLLALDEALDRLHLLDPRKAKLVTLRFFGGLTLVEAGNYLGISLRTAKRDWTLAKALLFDILKQGQGPS